MIHWVIVPDVSSFSGVSLFQVCHCFSCVIVSVVSLFLGARMISNFLLSCPLTLFLGSLQRESQWGALQSAQASLPHLCTFPQTLCAHAMPATCIPLYPLTHTHHDLLRLPTIATLLTDFACGKLTGNIGNDSHVTMIGRTGQWCGSAAALKQLQLFQISIPVE